MRKIYIWRPAIYVKLDISAGIKCTLKDF